MPALNSRQIGDMFVQVVVETPQKLSERQRELLHEFQKASSRDTNPESAGFFDKVREFFGDWQVRAERHKYGAEAI
jgi:molecular chaperone DnaJ